MCTALVLLAAALAAAAAGTLAADWLRASLAPGTPRARRAVAITPRAVTSMPRAAGAADAHVLWAGTGTSGGVDVFDATGASAGVPTGVDADHRGALLGPGGATQGLEANAHGNSLEAHATAWTALPSIGPLAQEWSLNATDARALCDALRAAAPAPGVVSCAYEAGFVNRVHTFNARRQATRPAYVVARPTALGEASALMRALAEEGRRRRRTPGAYDGRLLSIRNGGHNPRGASLAPVVIDMSANARALLVPAAEVRSGNGGEDTGSNNPRRSAADAGGSTNRANSVGDAGDGPVLEAGGGSVWRDAYIAMAGSGRVVVGGGCPGVGVAGLVGGGGIAWLSRARGLASESVLAYEVVLPNGTVTRATPGSELHRRLSGGSGAGLGLVWRLWLRTHVAPPEEKLLYAEFAWKAKGDGLATVDHAAVARGEHRQARTGLMPSSLLDGVAATVEAAFLVSTAEPRATIAMAVSRQQLLSHVFFGGSVAEGTAAFNATGVSSAFAKVARGMRVRTPLAKRTGTGRARPMSSIGPEDVRSGVAYGGGLTIAQIAKRADMNQGQAWWRSLFLSGLSADQLTAHIVRLSASAPDDCGLQVEFVGGAMDRPQHSMWGHVGAEVLLSMLCVRGSVLSGGADKRRTGKAALFGAQAAERSYAARTELWMESTATSLAQHATGRAYVGYQHDADTPEALWGEEGARALRELRASLQGAAEVFGDELSGAKGPGETSDPRGHDPKSGEGREVAVVVGGTGVVGGATAVALSRSGLHVLVTGSSPRSCEMHRGRSESGGDRGRDGHSAMDCVFGDLSTHRGANALADEVAARVATSGGCLRALVLSAGAAPAAFTADNDTNARSTTFSVMYAGQLQLLARSLAPSNVRQHMLAWPWCEPHETSGGGGRPHPFPPPRSRVVFVTSGAAEAATTAGVTDLIEGASFDIPAYGTSMSTLLAEGTGGQAYAAASKLKYLTVADVALRLAARGGGRSTVELVAETAAGSVKSNTSAMLQKWDEVRARVHTRGIASGPQSSESLGAPCATI